MAESIVNTLYGNNFNGYSAGSKPSLDKFPETAGVHPMALRVLADNRMRVDGLHSKNWDEFIKNKDRIDFAFTLCGNALNDMAEACPVFPGQPITAHWGLEDPALATGSDEQVYRVFQDAFLLIRRRIDLFTNLPFEKIMQQSLKEKLKEIGNSP